ncbi:MAG: hypothetical protein ABIV10_00985 [Gemmatimonadaceae bacterium]
MSRRAARPGFALLAVLWMLAMLGAVAFEVHLLSRASRQAATHSRSLVRARWAAHGVLARAVEALDARLVADASGAMLTSSGDTLLAIAPAALEGVTAGASVIDARARLHLNLATDGELRRLAEAEGLVAEDAESWADAVVDYRDADDLRHARGAEADTYRAAGSSARPRNAPFDDVDELRAVYGMSALLTTRLAGRLTVTGDGRINVNAAPASVLRTIPFIDEPAAAAIVARRQRAPFTNGYDLALSLPNPARQRVTERMAELLERIAFSARDVELVAVAEADGGRVELRATLTLAGGSRVVPRQVVER